MSDAEGGNRQADSPMPQPDTRVGTLHEQQCDTRPDKQQQKHRQHNGNGAFISASRAEKRPISRFVHNDMRNY